MKGVIRFVFFEAAVLVVMGLITFIEINNYSLFQSFVSFVKTPASWFIGLSLAFIFSYFLQNTVTSFFRKNIADEERRKDFFAGFIVAIIVTSIITPYARQLILSFFNIFIPYFHVIILQALLIFYLLFKLNGDYEISTKYFLTSEAITLFYTAIILFLIA